MGKKLRVGVAGCGGISAAHIGSYLKNGDCELVAVADLNTEKARSCGERHGIRWYDKLDKMYDAEEVDAVSVCTPPGTHKQVVIEALERKINVLCEKPLSTNCSAAMEMAEAMKRNGTLLLVANCHIFHPPVRRLKEAVMRGEIGRITSYRNRFNWPHPDPERARMRGGALLDNGIHSIYIFRHLAGDIGRVSAFFDPGVTDIAGLQRCYAMVESTEGVPGIIEIDAFCSGKTDRGAVIEVFGEKGSAVVDYSGESFYMSESGEGRVILDPEAAVPDRFNEEINHFINCVLGKEQPVIGAAEGVTDLKVAEKVFEAGKENRAVEV